MFISGVTVVPGFWVELGFAVADCDGESDADASMDGVPPHATHESIIIKINNVVIIFS